MHPYGSAVTIADDRGSAQSAARRWADDGIAVNALMPGNVASTALARHMGANDLDRFGETTALALRR